jgi:hypothetical protein
MRVLALKLYPAESRMDVLVLTPNGKRLLVPYRWTGKEVSDPPPANWRTTVEAEVRRTMTVDRDVLSLLRKAHRRR